METIKEYAQRVGLTAGVVRDRGAQVEEGWEHHAYVLRLTIRQPLNPPRPAVNPIEIPWKQGYGIKAHPTDVPWDVLASLVMDARSFEDTRFPDEDELEHFARWSGDFGYEDLHRAVSVFRAVRDTSVRLRDLLGDDYAYVVSEVDID